MDHAYLKVRNVQGTAGGCSAETGRSVYSNNSSHKMLAASVNSNMSNQQGPAKIANPVYTENLKAYNQLSQTLSSLHAQ